MPLRRPTRQELERTLSPYLRDHARGGWCLVIDADRTLSPDDTGRRVGRILGVNEEIRAAFETHGYSEAAFSRVAAIWGCVDNERYFAAITEVADTTKIHAAWDTILEAVRGRVPVVVVTAGIPHVWRRILTDARHFDALVVGGCNQALDPYLVCPETKAELVAIVQEHGLRVAAAGDSPIDLPMLMRADAALFVPDPKGSPTLRKELHRVRGVHHLVVDERRFEGLPRCTADRLIQLVLEGGQNHADRSHR